jgi:hypothetical protein
MLKDVIYPFLEVNPKEYQWRIAELEKARTDEATGKCYDSQIGWSFRFHGARVLMIVFAPSCC